MSLKKIEDERIITEKRKINSNAFGICLLVLWGMLLYRQFILKQEPSEYMDIFLLTLGLSIYVTVNSVFKGLYLTYRNKQERKKVNLTGAIVGSITFILVQLFVFHTDFTNMADFLKLIVSVIIFFVAWISAQSFLLNMSDKKANEDADDNMTDE